MTYQESLAALADPTRRQIFEALADAPRPVGELAQSMPVSRPAVSQHLKVLSGAGLVMCRVEGARRIYAVRPEGIAQLRMWLDRHWANVMDRFAEEINRKDGLDD
ncbi:metalloregulator ArsR/SmtB family transcription factor [Aliiroseovarius sp. F47248L]|uniref:ArsR/SmtB family transcription factor n=1 Tax=Aliiroseovarius sp. F47248L TaxID=2926420 RepID=UPI001FF454CE|nr:metalloregulator ArsR/SmtB family transcription factor [Aliiroseovarius sp. F47248L]MCK0137737.1 metalloregulator ArsR/SmtB family transcription factor [Aliiroseovarius sp. F47248L]